MKRFIDIRGQGTGHCFAWWDTVLDRFEEHSGSWAWNTWGEFVEDYEGDELARYSVLCPPWTQTQTTDD